MYFMLHNVGSSLPSENELMNFFDESWFIKKCWKKETFEYKGKSTPFFVYSTSHNSHLVQVDISSSFSLSDFLAFLSSHFQSMTHIFLFPDSKNDLKYLVSILVYSISTNKFYSLFPLHNDFPKISICDVIFSDDDVSKVYKFQEKKICFFTLEEDESLAVCVPEDFFDKTYFQYIPVYFRDGQYVFFTIDVFAKLLLTKSLQFVKNNL
ncbi:MAG: hypothetical protein NZZ41_05415 [Candidatus Dojkabacteria bacterium]|nr:hypothetical protein [Candidatus Dojkabacteria bacterium]